MNPEQRLQEIFGILFERVEDIVRLREFHYQAAYCVSDTGVLLGLCAVDQEITQVVIPAEWTELRYLNLSGNKNLRTLRFDRHLPYLEHLDVSDSGLTAIRLPEGFDRLRWLDLSRNQLEQFIQEGALQALAHLDLSGNQLKRFSAHALDRFPAIERLYLRNNPLDDVKRAGVDAEVNCLAFMQRFQRGLRRGETINKEHKILIVGNGGVGKSTLVERLVYDSFRERYRSTQGIVLEQYDKQPDVFILNLWDFGGQDIYHATHRLFMQSNAIYLLLWDEYTTNNPTTAIEENERTNNYNNYSLEYWLHYIRQRGGASPVIVIKTKEPTNNALHPLQEKILGLNPSLIFTRVDSAIEPWNRNGFRSLLGHIQNIIDDKPEQELIQGWADLRQHLRDLLKKEEKILSIDAYRKITEQYQVEAPLKVLTEWLVPSGVVFYRPEYFNDTILLDQSWALRAIYTLFNRDETFYHEFKEAKGKFSGADLLKIWRERDYNEGVAELLVDFMLSCEICFEITERDQTGYRYTPFAERRFMSPQLLSKDEPPSARVFKRTIRPDQCLYIRYEYDLLHYGVIQSFIFRAQQRASIEDIWQQGILISDTEGFVLVEAEPATSPQAGQKYIRVTSDRHNPELFDLVRNTLEKLQEGESQVTEWVSVNGRDFVRLDQLRTTNEPRLVADTGKIVEVEEFDIFLERKHQETLAKTEKMDQVRNLVSQGKLAEALQALSETVAEEFKNEVHNLQGQLSKLKRDERLGIIGYTEAGIQRNKITNSILQIHSESSGSETPPLPQAPTSPATTGANDQPKKILYVAATPDDEQKLQSDREYRRLQAEMERGRQREQYQFLPPKFAVTVGELLRAMNDDPTIVHFSGHGYSQGIVITTEDNRSQVMSLRALKRLFRPRKGKTQTVILNACYSAEQAREISKFGMYVIGNNNPITDPAAISFSDGLYNGLGEGKTLEAAFNDAMITIETENPRAADIIEVWKDGEQLDW